jgi:hypothetical protein
MESKLLHKADGQRTFSVMLQSGDEVMACLAAFAQRLGAAQFITIGAFSPAVLGYFDWERKDYLRTPIEEQIEVASLIGDVALGQNGEPALVAGLTLMVPPAPDAADPQQRRSGNSRNHSRDNTHSRTDSRDSHRSPDGSFPCKDPKRSRPEPSQAALSAPQDLAGCAWTWSHSSLTDAVRPGDGALIRRRESRSRGQAAGLQPPIATENGRAAAPTRPLYCPAPSSKRTLSGISAATGAPSCTAGRKCHVSTA